MRVVEGETLRSVRRLTAAGYLQRDQAFLLGITAGCVGQIAHLLSTS